MQRAAPRRRRSGLTLVELLVVITILVMLVGITIPLVRLVGDDKPVEEASRIIEMRLAAAQTRAMATGRDVALVLIRDADATDVDPMNDADPLAPTSPSGMAYQSSYQVAIAESPPPYSGESTNARAFVAPNSSMPELEAAVSFGDDLLVRQMVGFANVGDEIRFGFQGQSYTIVDVVDTVGYALPDSDPMSHPSGVLIIRPAPRLNPNVSYPFQLLRAPRRTSDEPVELPTGSFVSLNGTTMVNDDTARPFAREVDVPSSDIRLVFNSEGKLYRVFGGNLAFHADLAPSGRFVGSSIALGLNNVQISQLGARLVEPISITVAGGDVLDGKLLGDRQIARVRLSQRFSAVRPTERPAVRPGDISSGPTVTPVGSRLGTGD